MIFRRRDRARRGAAALEGAIVYPAFFMMLFMIIVGGMGVFHYQMCACLASEAARFACVRGNAWSKQAGIASPTHQQIFDQCVAPAAIAMHLPNLSISIALVDPGTGTATDWDSSTKYATTTAADGTAQTNRVRATVSYQWFPELFLAGPYTMNAVAELPMEF